MHDAQELNKIPDKMLPEFAPLSRSMIEYLLQDGDDRAMLLERVREARAYVYEYMDVFVRSDAKNNTRSFPSSEWLLEVLQEYTPEQGRNSIKSLELWQARNILQREQSRGRWELNSVAALLIMRLCNKTHQRRWLPASIPPDEPRWWVYGKNAPDAPAIPVSLPLTRKRAAVLLMLWTDWKGASWNGDFQQYGKFAVSWSRPPRDVEVAGWSAVYDQEIVEIATRTAIVANKEQQRSQGILISSPAVQQVIEEEIRRIQVEVQKAMLQEAARLILEQQALLLVKQGGL